MFCSYLYFSGLQIKHGYPNIEGGQIFTDSTELINRLSFRIYKSTPFLTEIKNILDWTVTATSLDIFMWFKLDDAYCNLYFAKV
jgi:hypothetical protein